MWIGTWREMDGWRDNNKFEKVNMDSQAGIIWSINKQHDCMCAFSLIKNKLGWWSWMGWVDIYTWDYLAVFIY